MKKIATCFLLLLFCLIANAQVPDNEPDSSIEIEIIIDDMDSIINIEIIVDDVDSSIEIEIIVDDVDSLLLFEFTDTTGVAHEISSTFGAHWRNGDFLCIYAEELWDCENFYLIKGSVKFRRLTKQQK